MYVAKCVNKDYMRHKLGKSQPFWKKLIIGFTLTLFVLTLIIGPIILFSNLNPLPQTDPVSSGQISVEIQVISDPIHDTHNTATKLVQSYTLFQTQHVTQLNKLSQEEYNELEFSNPSTSTSKFNADQVYAI